MHDIGRLGLLVAYADDYERIIRDAAERCVDLLDFEQLEFGLDHTAAGRILAHQWGLPPEFGIVAGRHHDPSDGAALDLLQIVHVACRLADALGYDVVKPLKPIALEDVISELPAKARERLCKNPAELRDRVQEQVSRYSSAEDTPAPEVTLAMLAPVEAQTGESAATAPASGQLDQAVPTEPAASQAEAKKTRFALRWAVAALLTLGAVALAATLLWRP